MANRFNLTAQLTLNGPSNVRNVVNQLNKQLSGVRANINININQRTINSIRAVNNVLQDTSRLLRDASTASTQLRSNLASLATTAGQTTRQARNLNNAARQLGTTMSTINRATREAGDGMYNFGRNSAQAIKKFGSFTIVTSAIVGLTVGVKNAIKEAAEFQHGLVRLSQITGVSTKNLTGLSDEITRLSTSLGVSSKDLLDISDTLAQAGLSFSEVKIALDGLAKTKLAPTFGDIKNTVEAAIASMRQFNIPVEKLSDTLGSFNAVSAAFAVEADDISTAVRRSGAAFQAAGGSLDEFIALFTSVRQTTREGAETIATGFRTIFTRLQRPKTIEYFKSLGVELTDAKGKFIGGYEAVRRLSQALESIESTDPRFAAIVEELGGFRQVSKVIPLLQQFSVAENALTVAQRGRTSVNKDAVTAQESMLVQLTKLRERFYELFRTIGNNESVQSFLGLALKLANSLISITEALTPLIPLFASLGAVKLGSGIVNFGRGFGAGLRTPNRFAKGGLVPGSGNSDTVPAILTPGEYVIPKHVVQAIGHKNFEKFAEGGKVPRKYGLAALLPVGKKIPPSHEKISLAGIDINAKNAKLYNLTKEEKDKKEYNFDIISATVPSPVGEQFENILKTKLNDLVESQAQFILKSVGASSKTHPVDLNKFNFEQLSGNIFEAALNAAGAPFNEKRGSTDFFDFRKGMKGLGASIFGEPLFDNIPVDAKRQVDSRDSIKAKVLNYFKQLNSTYTLKDLRRKKLIGGKFSTGVDKLLNSGFGSNLAPNARRNVAEAALKPQPKRKFADGGSAGPDTVPAMLTPGEYVLDKSTAQRIGYGNLEKIRKFNKGGLVQKFASGGQVASVGFAAAAGIGGILYVLPQITSQFGDMGKELTGIISHLTALIGVIALTGKSFTGLNNNQAIKSLLNGNRQQALLEAGKSNFLSGKNSPLGRFKLSSSAGRAINLGAGVTAGALGAGGIIASTAGNYFSGAAHKTIEAGKGNDATAQAAGFGAKLSAAGTGAAGGAAIGAFAGPIGAAVGGLIGAAVGWFSEGETAFNEAKKRIDFISFTKDVDYMSKQFTALSQGVIGLGGIDLNAVSELASQSNTDKDKEAEFKRLAPGISDYIKKSITARGGVDKLRQDSRIDPILQQLAKAADLSTEHLIQSLEKEEKARQSGITLQEKFNKVLAENFKQVEALKKLTDAYNQATQVFTDMSSEIELITSGYKTIGFNKDVSGVIDKGLEGNPQELQKVLSQFLGSSNTGLQNSIVASSNQANALPSILKEATAKGFLDKEEELQTFINKKLQAINGDKDTAYSASVSAEILKKIQASGGPADFLNSAQNDPNFAKELGKEASQILEPLKQAISQASNIINGVIKSIQQRTPIKNDISDIDVRRRTLGNQIIRNRAAQGLTSNFNKSFESTSSSIRKDIQTERAIRFRGTSLNSSTASASDISNAILNRRNLISQNSQAIQNAGISPDQALAPGVKDNVRGLAESSETAQHEIDQLTIALKQQADSTELLTTLQRELAQAEEKRLKKKEFATELAFAGREGRADFAKNLQLTKVIANNPNAIGSADQEGKVLQTLDKIIGMGSGDVKLFNGKSANTVKDDRTAAFLKATGLTNKEIAEVIKISQEERKKQQEIINAQLSMRDALDELKKLKVDDLNKLNNTLESKMNELIAIFNSGNPLPVTIASTSTSSSNSINSPASQAAIIAAANNSQSSSNSINSPASQAAIIAAANNSQSSSNSINSPASQAAIIAAANNSHNTLAASTTSVNAAASSKPLGTPNSISTIRPPIISNSNTISHNGSSSVLPSTSVRPSTVPIIDNVDAMNNIFAAQPSQSALNSLATAQNFYGDIGPDNRPAPTGNSAGSLMHPIDNIPTIEPFSETMTAYNYNTSAKSQSANTPPSHLKGRALYNWKIQQQREKQAKEAEIRKQRKTDYLKLKTPESRRGFIQGIADTNQQEQESIKQAAMLKNKEVYQNTLSLNPDMKRPNAPEYGIRDSQPYDREAIKGLYEKRNQDSQKRLRDSQEAAKQAQPQKDAEFKQRRDNTIKTIQDKENADKTKWEAANQAAQKLNEAGDKLSKVPSSIEFNGRVEPIQIVLNGDQIIGGKLGAALVDLVMQNIRGQIPGLPPAPPSNIA